jgi:hypothetical protein
MWRADIPVRSGRTFVSGRWAGAHRRLSPAVGHTAREPPDKNVRRQRTRMSALHEGWLLETASAARSQPRGRNDESRWGQPSGRRLPNPPRLRSGARAVYGPFTAGELPVAFSFRGCRGFRANDEMQTSSIDIADMSAPAAVSQLATRESPRGMLAESRLA